MVADHKGGQGQGTVTGLAYGILVGKKPYTSLAAGGTASRCNKFHIFAAILPLFCPAEKRMFSDH